MKKEFMQSKDNNKEQSYRMSVICKSIAGYAKEYIKENRKATANIDITVRNAVLVDSINYLAITHGFEFDLRTTYLYRKKYPKKVEAQYLLTILVDSYADYIFNEDMVDSVLLNCYSNNCRQKFDVNDGALVLMDFINYIAKTNDFDRIFTLKELYEKAQLKKHKEDLDKLKSFLYRTEKYYEKMQKGETVESIYNKLAVAYDLKCVSEEGIYYYTDEASRQYGTKEMFIWDEMIVEKRLYAIAYAYAKMNGINQLPEVPIIKRKIVEMSGR